MASSAELHDPNDGILRPRPRKPVHSQLSQLAAISGGSNGHIDTIENGFATGETRCVFDQAQCAMRNAQCIAAEPNKADQLLSS